jgi:hypothetical protein
VGYSSVAFFITHDDYIVLLCGHELLGSEFVRDFFAIEDYSDRCLPLK